MLSQYGALSPLTPANRNLLTGREFFPDLISGPFHDGLVVAFAVSLMRGTSKPPAETETAVTPGPARAARRP